MDPERNPLQGSLLDSHRFDGAVPRLIRRTLAVRARLAEQIAFRIR